MNVGGGNVFVDGQQVGTSSSSSSVSGTSSESSTTTVTVNGKTISSSTTGVDGGISGNFGQITTNPSGSLTVNVGGLSGSQSGSSTGSTTTSTTIIGGDGSISSGFSPSGSSSTSGSTSGSTTSSTTIISTSNSGLATKSVGYNPKYPTGPNDPFPSQTFPTGPSTNFISSNIPTQISNFQYTVNSARDEYQATASDIQSQAIFQRQINANKAVANLLSIIQQLTANVNGVQADIPAATAALNQAIADQRTIQQRIVAA